jgi:hypothetical protein
MGAMVAQTRSGDEQKVHSLMVNVLTKRIACTYTVLDLRLFKVNGRV